MDIRTLVKVVFVMIDDIGRVLELLEKQEDMLGNSTIGRAVSATLRVSPNGSGVDGQTWSKAFTTIPEALDAASSDDEDSTLILIAPHGAGYYDIDTDGDPTWAKNVILKGTHRNWAKIMNGHDTATSILKLTGRASVIDLNFNLGTGNNGLILTRGGWRCYSCQFVGLSLTGAATAFWADGSATKHGKLINSDFLGVKTQMTAVKVDDTLYSRFHELVIHDCLKGIHILGTAPDRNDLDCIDIGGCAIGIDIDTGSGQHFRDILLHGNDVNIDDEVGDHHWAKIYGAFPIDFEPTDLVGTQVNCGAAGVYGGDTELRAVADSVPFRVVGYNFAPSANEWYAVRFSADNGATWFDEVLFDGNKHEGIDAPSGTEFIFNKGTRISASAKSVTGGNNAKIWLKIQEI